LLPIRRPQQHTITCNPSTHNRALTTGTELQWPFTNFLRGNMACLGATAVSTYPIISVTRVCSNFTHTWLSRKAGHTIRYASQNCQLRLGFRMQVNRVKENNEPTATSAKQENILTLQQVQTIITKLRWPLSHVLRETLVTLCWKLHHPTAPEGS
jgi:hypothetical protein